jgi:hypothetical protein
MTPAVPHWRPVFSLHSLLSIPVVYRWCLIGGGVSMDLLSIPALVKSTLLALHLLGLVLGLGAATMLDLIIVRFVGSRTVTQEYWSVISLLSKAVTGGLVLLWISGIGFLTHYAVFNPELLTNPKIWAKIAIVGVLSLNGVFIHRAVLPLVRRQVGGPLFEGLTNFQRSCLLASGAISGMSWWIPLGLGAFPQLNFTVGAETILAIYALLLMLAIIVASLVVRHVLPQLTTVTLPRAEYNDLVDRLSALRRVADAVSAGVSGPAGEMSYGPIAGGPPNARPARRRKSGRSGWLRPAVPAALALVVICLVYVLRPPVNQASGSAAERPDTGTALELASAAASPALEQRGENFEQRAADLPSWTESVYQPAQIAASQPAQIVAESYQPPQKAAQSNQPPPVAAESPSSTGPQSASPAHAVLENDDGRVPPHQAPAKAAFVGVWGANANACSAKSQSPDNPPAMISEDGARSGQTSCSFEKMRFDGSSWRAVARCFNGRERWTSRVRLTLKNDRLTWASQRGSETYQRCERAMMVVTTAQRANSR